VQFDWAKADNHRDLNQAQRELDAYFRGQLRSFAVALAPQGTAFQKLAWIALAAIPFGATQTYGQQALAIGRPSAARAVGAANGRNPIGIIIPCHRVIGAGGAMTGYGGGLAAKRFLLNLEDGQSGVNSHNESPPPPAT
jgi:methylated-DNA-[protein]-cysteine S-methyltransferase